MNRAFITLYFFIVVSVILIGWGLNQFWESLAPEQQATPEIRALFLLIEQHSRTSIADGAEDNDLWAQQIGQALHLNIDMMPLGDVARVATRQQLSTGEIMAASSAKETTWYHLRPNTDQVLLVTVPSNNENESPLYRLLLIGFYLGIALVIYLWIWPLSRDSKKLETQTRTLGKDGVPETLAISPASTLYPLAQAFNHMARRLRELIASHRDMTNAVSHELRTPLARMKFALALIEEGSLDDKSRRQLRSLEQDIAEMEALITALLMYAGFEQKTQQLTQTSGYIRDLFDEIQLRFIRQYHGVIELQLSDATNNSEFRCEWKLMETVLQNLIGNAARYARGRIRIEVANTAKEYVIAVEDDGPGVPVSERHRVFDSFVRLYSEPASDSQPVGNSGAGGFGLGLAIVKRIMQWHKGNAAFVEPRTLSGARVEIHWPKDSR